MTQAVKDQVRLRKGILDTDSMPCHPFSTEDIDAEIVKEFRRVFHPEATRGFSSDKRLLR